MSGGRQRGFSLLEVLVAFSILALSLGVLMQIFSGSLRNAELSRDQAQAVALAQTLLTSTTAGATLAAGESSGVLQDKFHWRVSTAPFQAESAATETTAVRTSAMLELWEVSVEVAWGSDAPGSRRSFVMSSLRVQPQAPR